MMFPTTLDPPPCSDLRFLDRDIHIKIPIGRKPSDEGHLRLLTNEIHITLKEISILDQIHGIIRNIV